MNLLTVSKLKIYILASENEKWIKISAYLCDVGVKFEQAAREKIIEWKELIYGRTSSAGNFSEESFTRKGRYKECLFNNVH